MNFTTRSVLNSLRFGVLACLLTACGSMNGCSGCEQSEGSFPAKSRMYNAAQLRVTSSGLNFIEENLATLIQQALPTGLNVCIPSGEIDAISLAYCPVDNCGTEMNPEPGCGLNIELGPVTLVADPPSTLRAVIEFEALSTIIPIQSRLPLLEALGKCNLNLNADGFSIEIPLLFDTPEPDQFLSFDFADTIKPDLNSIMITAGGDGDLAGDVCEFGQDVADLVEEFFSSITGGVSDQLRDVLIDVLEDVLVDDLVTTQVRELVTTATCRTCSDDMMCPVGSGSQCVEGQCLRSDGRCLRIPLGVEGQLDVGDLLSGITPGLKAIVNYLAVAGGYAEAENRGLSFGLVSGATSSRNRCVPRVNSPPLIDPPRSEILRGNTTPAGDDFHIGIGLTKEMVAQFVWSFFNTGALCVQITTDTIEQLNAGTLGLLLPDLTELARNPDASIAVTIAPQRVPEVIFGNNTFMMDEDGKNILVDPAIRLLLPELWLDFHIFMDDRWVRFMSVHADVDVPLGLDFTPDNKIVPIIGDLSDALKNVRTANTDILRDDPAVVSELLPTVVGGLIGGMTDGLIDPIEIPVVFGLQVDLSQGAVTAIDEGALLAIFARFSSAPMMEQMVDGMEDEAETDVGMREVRVPPIQSFENQQPYSWHRVEVEVDVAAHVPGETEAPMEVSWRANGGLWSPFQPVGRLIVKHPDFMFQGRHRLEFRSRKVGAYRTLDMSPDALEFIVDSVPPQLMLKEQGSDLRIIVNDLITAERDLKIEVRRVGKEWIEVTDLSRTIPTEPDLVVRVTDEAGNSTVARLGSRKDSLIGRPPPAERMTGDGSGCGCRTNESTGLEPWFFLILLGAIRRRSYHKSMALTACICFVAFTIGCDDDSGASSDADVDAGAGCQSSADCPSANYACVNGSCDLLDCREDSSLCETLKCEDGTAMCNPRGLCECVPFCPDGCASGTYCCPSTNTCEPEPAQCVELKCESGQKTIRELVEEGNPLVCGDEKFRCECEDLPPLPIGELGRFSDLAIVDGVAFVSAYSDTYGDLVFGRYETAQRRFVWEFVDGIPTDAEVTGNVNGPRGGIEDLGPNVGKYTAMVSGADGTKHIVYYDLDAKALKYAMGSPMGMTHEWKTTTIDAEGDAGRWPSLTLDAMGRPSVAYRVANIDGESQVRFRQATSSTPVMAADWGEPLILHRVMIDPDAAVSQTYPEGTGLFTSQARNAMDEPVVAWYDRTGGGLYISRFQEAGFSEPELMAGWGHMDPDRDGDMGANVDIAIDGSGQVHLCYQDGLTDSLRYLSPELDRDEWVDDGVWLDVGDRRHSVHVVGEDCNMILDGDENPLVVYQDATLQALLLRRRVANSEQESPWSRRVAISGDSARDPGSFGFFASAQLVDGKLWITQYVYRHTTDEPTQGLELVVIQL